MITGSILGDIIGSRFEFDIPDDFDYKTVDLFHEDCFFTDDTVMTLATKYAIENNKTFEYAYTLFGKKYPDAGYGSHFEGWIYSNKKEPYNSFGNGSAMRVSYIGECFKTLEDVEKYATKSAECTHNHPEGIKGAVATAQCIWMARHRQSKSAIKNFVHRSFEYDVDTSLDEIRPVYNYDVTCQGTVPVAIRCFLESDDYESCIRNVLSLDGDTDTMACIAGGIAEAFYETTGFNNRKIINTYLDSFLRAIYYRTKER